MKRTLVTTAVALLLALSLSAQDTHGHVMLSADELEWTPGPPSLPAGAEMVVLSGNPAAEGVFTMRLRLPANYRIPAHWHPAHEHVSVIDGTFSMGLGDSFDEAALREHGPGDFVMMEPGTRHFAASRDGAVIQLHGVGPWQINYVNADDDPRGRRTSMKR